MFKYWGTGNLVREEESFDGSTEYTHVESLDVNDRRVTGDFNRVSRNIFENQKEANDYLTSIANNSDQTRAIYRSSTGQELDFDAASTDKPVLTLVNTYEISPITAIANTAHALNSLYFNIYDGNDDRYHVWYDSENTGLDPGVEQSTFIVSWASSPVSLQSEYITFSDPSTNYYVWYNVDGSGVDPAPGGTGIEVTLLDASDTLTTTSIVTAAAIDAVGSGLIFTVPVPTTATFIITNIATGNVTDATEGDSDFATPTVNQQGSALGTGIEIDITDGDTADEVKDATVLQLNSQTALLLAWSTDTDDFSIRTTTPGNPTDTTDGDTGFAFGGITQASTVYGYYLRVTPGIFFYENEILVVKPQTQIAERQLEKIFSLQTYLATPEEVIVWYDETNDKFQARISMFSNDTLTNYDFLNGGVWQTSGGFDTGIELLYDIYSHILFHSAMVTALGDHDLTTITLEPVVEVSTTETNDFLGFDDSKDLVISATSLNASNGFDLYQIDYAPTGGANTVTIDTDLRTFFQNSNDYRQVTYYNVPESISGSDDGTENLGSLDATKITDQDVEWIVLRNNGTGSQVNAIFKWDEATESWMAQGLALAGSTSGTSFPAGPSLGQGFYKTDVPSWYKYNGTSWVQI